MLPIVSYSSLFRCLVLWIHYIPLITISSDTVNNEETMRPEKYDTHALMFISIILGTLTAFFELIFFALLKIRSSLFVETSMFLYLTFVQLIVIVSIRNQDHFWKGKRPSTLLAIAISLAFISSLALPYIPILAGLFSFTPLPLSQVGIILGLVVIYLFALDRVKVWYYRIVERSSRKSV